MTNPFERTNPRERTDPRERTNPLNMTDQREMTDPGERTDLCESTDAFTELILHATRLVHPAFVQVDQPASARCEFYHQFRKLWDRGIPVGMGLGHLLVRPVEEHSLGIHQLGEAGRADQPLAAIRFQPPFTPVPGFPRTFAIVFTPCSPSPGVTFVQCAPARGTATVLST